MTETTTSSEDIEFHHGGHCRIGRVLAWAARQAACNQEMRIIERRSACGDTKTRAVLAELLDLMGA